MYAHIHTNTCYMFYLKSNHYVRYFKEVIHLLRIQLVAEFSCSLPLNTVITQQQAILLNFFKRLLTFCQGPKLTLFF